jgi:tetratricopeptide (TPR) repeat protein
MRLFIKSVILFILTVGLVYMVNGCNTAEQTTGMIAYSTGDFEKAEKEFDLETKQNPVNEEAWFYLAMSRAKLNKVEGVQEAMTQYRKIGKNTFQSELTQQWGQIFDMGFKRFQVASQIKSDSAIPIYNAAINSFKICLLLEPDSVIAQKNIDIINNKVNTIAIKPLLDKGIEMEGKNDYAGAVAQYKKALDLVGPTGANHEIVIYDLGVGYLKWGEKLRDSLMAINPDEKSYKEEYQAALPYLEELGQSKDKANRILAYELLVQVYGNLGMNDKALEAIKIRDQLKGENK